MTPAIVGTVLAIANLPVYWLLVRRFQHIGLALASSIGIIAYTVALFVLLNRRTHNPDGTGIALFFAKVCGASTVVAYICYRLQLILEPHFAWHTIPGAFALLVIVTSAGIVMLFLASKLLGIREFDELAVRIRKMLVRNPVPAL
jgi:peptidoglycan biosynthesis protein MviN/MurJ (putative lipid II flippase)